MYTNVHQKGNYMYVRAIEDGQRVSYKVDFQPTIWMQGKLKDSSTEKWHTVSGRPVYAIQPGTMWETKQFIDRYKGAHGIAIYEATGHTYQYIAETYPDDSTFADPKGVVVYVLDIETETENGFPNPVEAAERILLLTIEDTSKNKIITWGLYPFNDDPNHPEHRPGVEYRQFDTEQAMLKDFTVWWSMHCPDIVTGWFTSQFDITYMYNRMVKIVGEKYAKLLSPWKQVRQREIEFKGRTFVKTYIAGVAHLDYVELYQKFTYKNRESYSLDHICEIELGEKKLENPGVNFKDFYTNYWDDFVRYNIRDVNLVIKLDLKMKLMAIAIVIAYLARVNFEDVFGPVKLWDNIIYNYLNRQKIVIPRRKSNTKEESFAGAYVKDPLIGKHNMCASLDLDSLYPMLVVQYNMSPETITDLKLDVSLAKLLDKSADLQLAYDNNYAVAANGWCFSKEKQGLLPTQMQRYFDQRAKYKKQMIKAKKEVEAGDTSKSKEVARLNNLQMAIKILLNSAYGSCGNPHFRYYDIRIAEGITYSGRFAIQWIANHLNGYLNNKLKTTDKDRVVLIDTDSVVLSLEELINTNQSVNAQIDQLDKLVDKTIQPLLDKWYGEMAEYTNAYQQKMHMKRENLVDTMISIGKKNYVMSVYDSEGVRFKTPELKVMGLQMVKTSTPAVIRKVLRDTLPILLYGEEGSIQDYVKNYRAEFNKLTVEQIAFPRSMSDLGKYDNKNTIYSKGTPIHVRGSLLYNYYLRQKKLTKDYHLIHDGDKIKFLYLKLPNPIHEDCIAFLDKLPVEFGLHSYVDYDTMFEKAFQKAVQNSITPLGWSAERISTLDDWFT